MTDIRYDRRVSEDFLALFAKRGVAHSLVAFANSSLFPLDLQFHKDLKTKAEHATLYVGLTAVLNLKRNSKGELRLSAHAAHASKAFGFEQSWTKWAPVEAWAQRWLAVETYLERVIPAAVKKHGVTEGAVQTAVSRFWKGDRIVVDREVTPSFKDAATKRRILAECKAEILDVLSTHDFKAGVVPKSFGTECDLLAYDKDGRILAVEVKPYNGSGVAWVAAQAAMYAKVLQHWIDNDSSDEKPAQVLEGMLKQRQSVGLASRFELSLPPRPVVTPVVALQRGAKKVYVDRMLAVRDALAEANVGPRVEIYEVSMTGKPEELS
jgi:hypothetical protein